MAAPTKPANVKKALANSEPSTHGTKRTSNDVRNPVAIRGRTDIVRTVQPAEMISTNP